MGSDAGAVGGHIVGRVPLDGPEDVFRTVSEHAGALLRRIPDGETETNWIGMQVVVLGGCDQLERLSTPELHLVPFTLRAGVDPDELELPELGYASIAKQSFAILRRLKDEGVVREDVRLQVNLPSPTTVTLALIGKDSQALVEPAYERAIIREVQAVLDAIPHDQLTIGFDLPSETVAIEGGYDLWYDGSVEDGAIERLSRLVAAIPEDVPLGFHLCLGSRNNVHELVPADATNQVSLINRLLSELPRSVQWLHLPIPRDVDTDAYVAPFAKLKLSEGTELFLGVVAVEDGLAATQRRIDAASAVIPRFGVATECGLAGEFYPRDAVIELLDIHAKVAAPIAG